MSGISLSDIACGAIEFQGLMRISWEWLLEEWCVAFITYAKGQPAHGISYRYRVRARAARIRVPPAFN